MNLIGAVFGGTLVAALIIPKLYNAKTITIYGYIGDRFGETAKRANSLMFQKELFGNAYIAWTWWCPIGGVISTLVCMSGKPEKD